MKINTLVWYIVKTLLLSLSFFTSANEAKKLNVLTSTTNIKSLTKYIAGDYIQLDSLTKKEQDPHFLSAKPSYMLKAAKSDLFIFNGLDLEVGWLSLIIQGAKNPQIQKGQSGHLDASQFISALSVPQGKVDRFFGDIHPFGNPHYFLDPLRAIQVSKGILQKLLELDSKNKEHYIKNQKLFEKNIKEKMKEWRKRIQKSKVKKVVTYHSSFEYFLDRFQLKLIGSIEEKPGIPPSAKHILNLIKKIKSSQSSCVLVSSFYNRKWEDKIQSLTPIHVESVAVEVMALKNAKNYSLLIENIVQAIENCGVFAKNKNKRKKT